MGANMSSRDYPSHALKCNELEPVLIFARATFAADAQANGASIARGSKHTTALTRTGEGLWTWDLTDTFAGLLFVDARLTKLDTQTEIVSETVATDGKIALRFVTAGSALDPDSATVYLFAALTNSATNVG